MPEIHLSIVMAALNGKLTGLASGHVGFLFSAAVFLPHRYRWQHDVLSFLLVSALIDERVDRHHHHRYQVLAAAPLSIGICKRFATVENFRHQAPIIGQHFPDLCRKRLF